MSRTSLVRNVLIALLVLLAHIHSLAEVRIKPSTPPGVEAGKCFQFTANQPGIWSVTCRGEGCQAGTIDEKGLYCAPSAVVPKNQSRGCQLGPNNNVYNVPVNKLPVHPYSSRWMDRIASENDGGAVSWIYHRFIMSPPGVLNFFDNVVDNATAKQQRHFRYGGPWQDTAFSQPLPPDLQIQSGWSMDVEDGLDRHIFSINRETCDDEEIYNDYVDYKSSSFIKGNPTVVKFTTNSIRPLQNPLRVYIAGASASCGINGKYLAKVVGPGELEIPFDSTNCSLSGVKIAGGSGMCSACNSAGGAHWPVASNAILYGVDAAGAPMSRTSVHSQEWWNAVQQHILDPACNCITLGHAIRTTLTNGDIAPADQWPSINGQYVTWGHPRIHPNSISNTNPATFVVGAADCHGQSFLQCMKPCDHWTFSVGCKFYVVLGGGTGNWARLNGKHIPAIATDENSFKIPVDSSGNPLPPTLYFYFDWPPYGTRFRLKSSFNVADFCSDNSLTSSCPYEKALLNTLQVYGMVLLDGTLPTDNWDSGIVADEFFPDELVDAISDMNRSPKLGFNKKWPEGGGFEQWLEVVDPSSLQLSSDPSDMGATDSGRVIVTLTTPNKNSASVDVNLIGTTVGVSRGRIAIAAMPGNSYQLDAWVNGNANKALKYVMSPNVPGASISQSGLVTPPSSLAKMTKTTVTACSAATGATNQCAYVDVFFIPVSRDGKVRLWFGGHQPTYTDRSGNTWWGQIANRGFNSLYEIADGVNFAVLNGTWQFSSKSWDDTPDAQLYAQSTSARNDILLNIAVPNGSYQVTLYGEPGYGVKASGQDVFDIEVGGDVVASYQDGYTLAGGQFHGWTKQFDARVSKGILEVGARIRENSSYGISLSSLLIAPKR